MLVLSLFSRILPKACTHHIVSYHSGVEMGIVEKMLRNNLAMNPSGGQIKTYKSSEKQ